MWGLGRHEVLFSTGTRQKRNRAYRAINVSKWLGLAAHKSFCSIKSELPSIVFYVNINIPPEQSFAQCHAVFSSDVNDK